MTVEVRAPRRDEAEAIAALLNAHSRSMWGGDAVDPAVVENWFSLPNIQPEDDMRVAAGPDGELLAYVDVNDGGVSRTRFAIDLRLSAAAGAEVGIELVQAMEARARERATPGALTRGIYPEQDDGARRVFATLGYELVRHSFRMERSLADEPPPPEWPQGITLRPSTDDLHERIWAAAQDGFADHWEFEPRPFAEWLRFQTGPGNDETLWFVAFDGDEVAGTCLCNPSEWGDPGAGYVDSLSVRPPWRRRGLALALLLHSFREFRARGRERASLGVDAENTTGAVRLYERAGMHVTRRFDWVDRPLA